MKKKHVTLCLTSSTINFIDSEAQVLRPKHAYIFLDQSLDKINSLLTKKSGRLFHLLSCNELILLSSTG